MSVRSKNGKGKSKRKGRGRKTTDWLNGKKGMVDFIGDQTASEVDVTGSTRQQILDVSGGNANQTFVLKFDTETTDAIKRNASAKDVEKAVRKLDNVKSIVATGGPLLTAPVVIDFRRTTLREVPLVIPIPSNDIEVNPGASVESAWQWSAADNWKDANSGRDIMSVGENMLFTADSTGLWRLAFDRKLYAFDHRWVYKLNAYTIHNELLLRLTIPASGGINTLLPGSMDQLQVTAGMSVALADVLPEIHTWVRFGVGEYWD